jgi:hypothetical protein
MKIWYVHYRPDTLAAVDIATETNWPYDVSVAANPLALPFVIVRARDGDDPSRLVLFREGDKIMAHFPPRPGGAPPLPLDSIVSEPLRAFLAPRAAPGIEPPPPIECEYPFMEVHGRADGALDLWLMIAGRGRVHLIAREAPAQPLAGDQ